MPIVERVQEFTYSLGRNGARLRAAALGRSDPEKGIRLVEQCKQLGLVVETACVVVTRHTIYNELNKSVLIIEDDELATAVTREAIDRGVPVRSAEILRNSGNERLRVVPVDGG